MIKINQKINDFETDALLNDKIKKIKLSDYKNKWIIIMFYPADFTFVCPTELEEMAALYNEFKKNGADSPRGKKGQSLYHGTWDGTGQKNT